MRPIPQQNTSSSRAAGADEEPTQPDADAAAVTAWRNKVAIAVGAGVGLAAAHLFFGLSAASSETAELALEWALHYLVLGPIVGLLCYCVIAATVETAVLFGATSCVGAYVFLSWFAWPVLYQRPAAALGELGDAAIVAARNSQAAAREEWLRALIAERRYGKPGEAPPMLDVQWTDTGAVGATNIGDEALVVSLAIVAVDAEASGGWRGCGFSGYAGEGAQEWVTLEPGGSALFELEPLCRELFLDLESFNEFRVGNESVPTENGWWSASALVAPHGRESERGSGNTALPSSYDAHAFYGSRE